MTPEAVGYSGNLVAPRRPTQTKGVRYDIPILREHQQGVNELEALLLAWSLLLYRHSHGEHVQYSWGLSELGTSTSRTFEVNTSTLSWSADNSVSTALGVFRSYLQDQLQSEYPIAADRFQFFFNDECAPSGSFSHINEEGDFSINWVRTCLEHTMYFNQLTLSD